jgi:aspartate/tyrosine/aromatic aminotransferase
MYELLTSPEPDEILQLSVKFQADSRVQKADLGIGVYKDEHGRSPVMRSIKKAEQLLLSLEDTKAYLGLPGDEAFNSSMRGLIFGRLVPNDQVSVIQTPGGSGAIRLLLELVQRARPSATVWISDPSWANHNPMTEAVGLKRRSYPYLDRTHQTLAFAEMMEGLAEVRSGDVIILHGCCHNPSGVDLTLEQWAHVADLINATGAIPLVDVAYQGLGEGLDEDASGMRLLAKTVPELLVASSCSKNFGVYRDRVGCAALLNQSPTLVRTARANLLALARVNYSFPPCAAPGDQ